MDCLPLLEESEQRFLNGSLPAEDLAALVAPCFPAICSDISGKADFDLAGPGVYISNAIAVVLFITFGLVESFASRFKSSRASTRTKLVVSRFEAIMDSVYTAGTLLASAILITALIRTQSGMSGLERSIVKDYIDVVTMLQNMAMMVFWVRKSPSKVRRSGGWGPTRAWLICQGLGILGYILKKRLDKTIGTSKYLVTQLLCTQLASKEYPEVSGAMTKASPPWNPFVVGIGLGILLLIAIGLAGWYLPDMIMAFFKSLFESTIVRWTIAILWSQATLYCALFPMVRLHYTRASVEGAGWDLAQILALMIWVRPFWHILLTVVSIFKPAKIRSGVEVLSGDNGFWNGIIEQIYANSFGTEEMGTVTENDRQKRGEEREKSIRGPSPCREAPSTSGGKNEADVENDVERDTEPLIDIATRDEERRNDSPGAQV